MMPGSCTVAREQVLFMSTLHGLLPSPARYWFAVAAGLRIRRVWKKGAESSISIGAADRTGTRAQTRFCFSGRSFQVQGFQGTSWSGPLGWADGVKARKRRGFHLYGSCVNQIAKVFFLAPDWHRGGRRGREKR